MPGATVDDPRAAAWGNGSAPHARGAAGQSRSVPAGPERVPAVLPWPLRPPRRVAGIPVGLLVCWQVAVLLALVAIGQPVGAVIALGTAAALVVIVTALRPRGRWVHEWLVLWLRYTFRGQRVPDRRQPPALALLDLAATTETVDHVEIDGDEVAMISHAHGYTTALELRTEALSPYLPLTLAPRHQPDAPVVSVQLLVHATPVVPATPVATVRSWLAVQVARDPGYQPEELRGALVNAVRRLQRRLRSAQLDAQLADRSRLVEALHTLTRLDHAGPPPPGADDRIPVGAERWGTWWTRGVPQESVAIRNWPGAPGPPGSAVFDVLLSPRWPQTVSIAGRRMRLPTAHGALQAGEEVLTVEVVVRVSERDRSNLAAAVRQLCDRLRAAGARVERLDGRQLPALAATMPTGGFLPGYAPSASAFPAPPRRKARRLLSQPGLPAAAAPAGPIPPPLNRDVVPPAPPAPLPPPPAPAPPPRQEPLPAARPAAAPAGAPPSLPGRVPPPPGTPGHTPPAPPPRPPQVVPSPPPPPPPAAPQPLNPPPVSAPPAPPVSAPPVSAPPVAPASAPPAAPSSAPTAAPSSAPPAAPPGTPEPIEIRPLFPARGQAGVPAPPATPEPPPPPVRGQATVPPAPAEPARGQVHVPVPDAPAGREPDAGSWFDATTSSMPTALRGVATPPTPPPAPAPAVPGHPPVPPQPTAPPEVHGAARAYGASLFTSESRRRDKVEQLITQVRTPHRSAQVVAVLAGDSGVGTSTTAAGMARILATLRDDYTALLSVEKGRVTAATIQDVNRKHAFVVVDLGGHTGEATPQALSISTRVVIVTSADQHDPAATRAILDRIHRVKPMLAAGAVVAVVCKTGRQYRRVVRDLSEESTPQSTQAIPIPADPAVRTTDDLDLTRLAQVTREAYLRLAAAVAVPRPAAAGGAPASGAPASPPPR